MAQEVEWGSISCVGSDSLCCPVKQFLTLSPHSTLLPGELCQVHHLDGI